MAALREVSCLETAAAIRRAWEAGGELAGVVELRRHFPLITDNEQARRCVWAIVGWAQQPRPAPDQEQEQEQEQEQG